MMSKDVLGVEDFREWIETEDSLTGFGKFQLKRLVDAFVAEKTQRYTVHRITNKAFDYMVTDTKRNANLAIFYQKNYTDGTVYCAKKEAEGYCAYLNRQDKLVDGEATQ